MVMTVIRVIFIAAAAFNGLVGLNLLVSAYGVPPDYVPTMPILDPFMIRLLAGLILTFGIGYIIVALKPYEMRPIILLGMLGKMVVIVIGLADLSAGLIEAEVLIPALGDAVFVILFGLCYRSLNRTITAPDKQGRIPT